MNVGNGSPQSGGTFSYYPQRNFVASDVASNSLNKDIGVFGVFIHEELSEIFGGYAKAMVTSDVRGVGRGAVGHTAVPRNDLSANERVRDYDNPGWKTERRHDRGGIIHVYTDANGSARTDTRITTPAGWTGTPTPYFTGGFNGGNFDSLDTIVEEVAHTVQFLQTWAKRYQAIYIGSDLGGYDAAKGEWAGDYAYYAAKGRLQNGDGYKNDVEKWAKNRKYDILSTLLSDKKLVQQGNVCGYDLTNYSLNRPDW